MKMRIAAEEIAVLMAAALSAALCPVFGFPAYAGSQEGVCFYFDRMSASGGQSGGDVDAAENTDRTPEEGVTHWEIGDTVLAEIQGVSYRFRCIDQNYADQEENHRQGALFLCDTVIPADTGSKYEFEELSDGSHGYVFYPGRIVDFGDSNEYKYSRVRQWLTEAVDGDGLFSDALDIHTGVSRAYTGCTLEGMYGQLDESGLTPSAIGSQQMTDRLFVLSVEEAVKYRDWLWRFEGASEENPYTQIGAYCKGYWLRSPAGSGSGYDTGQVYVVDLVQGNLHPAAVCPQTGQEVMEAELRKTGIYGVRPAFVLPQDT